MTESAAVTQTVRDGVPVLLAPGSGPAVTGGIVFRVGYADETAAVAGITHLVEHLVLSTVYTGSVHENGQTLAGATMMYATGSVEDVVRFLNGVCAALRNLPLDRLEIEKQVILTEGAGRSAASPLLMARYGAQGYGLGGVQELGMHRVAAEEVQAWSAARFTSGNAVAFLTVDAIPEGLDLTLPAGPRLPGPTPQQILVATPAYVTGPDEIVAQGIVERSPAAAVFAQVARRTLFTRLREQEGVSYAVDASCVARDATTSTLTVLADARQDTVVRASEVFLDALQGLCNRGVPPDELSRAISDVRRSFGEAVDAQLLPSHALAVLQGRPVVPVENRVAEVGRVTAEEVRRIAQQLWATMLVRCSPAASAAVAAAGISPAQIPAAGSVSMGISYRRKGDGAILRLSKEGVSLGQQRVLFAESPALLCWPDGGRALVDRDGTTLAVEPTMYSGLRAARLVRLVDARMEPDRIVRMPARDPGAIPRFTGRQVAYVMGLAFLLAISVTLLVAAVVAGVTDGLATGIGLAVLGAPFWVGSAWMLVSGHRRRT